MKKIIALVLCTALFVTGCGQAVGESEMNVNSVEVVNNNSIEEVTNEDIVNEDEEQAEEIVLKISEEELNEINEVLNSEYDPIPEFKGLDDEELLSYMEDDIYNQLVEELDSNDYFVSNISTVYVSKEYLEENEYNSQANIYFGHTIADLDAQFQGTRYVFTLGDRGETIVKPLEDYDDTNEKIVRNVAIGTGVILICVVVSVATEGAGAAAISAVFAASAKSAGICALSGGVISGAMAAIVTGIKTGDMEQALKDAELAASEGYMWGAISGAVSGGISKYAELSQATLNGLSMNEAAIIQRESGFPIEVIRQFHTMDEYQVFKEAGLTAKMVNGNLALIQAEINLDLVDDMGRTNLQRMAAGLSPLDENGLSYELHHIGQEANGTIAVLTQSQHDNIALHGFKDISVIDRNAFKQFRKKFWKEMAKMFAENII